MRVYGQTGRFFLPPNFMVGWKPTLHPDHREFSCLHIQDAIARGLFVLNNDRNESPNVQGRFSARSGRFCFGTEWSVLGRIDTFALCQGMVCARASVDAG
jgi:hypothetical protein